MTYDRRAFLKTTVAASAALMTDVQTGVEAGPQSPALFPGFVTQKIKTSGATIHAVRGGSGPSRG
jgi:hypothetical protein